MKRLLTAVAGLLIGSGAAVLDMPSSRAIGVQPTERAFRTSTGGADNQLGVSLVPSRIVATAAGETLEMELSLTNRFPGPADAEYQFDLGDDSGTNWVPAVASAPIALASAGSSASFTISTPSGLPDGFYAAAVTAAAVSGAEAASSIVSFYFQVSAGRVYGLDYGQWFALSRVHIEVRP